MHYLINGDCLDPSEATVWKRLVATGGATLQDLLRASLLEEDTVRLSVASLLAKGLIQRHDTGHYTITLPVVRVIETQQIDEDDKPARAA